MKKTIWILWNGSDSSVYRGRVWNGEIPKIQLCTNSSLKPFSS